MNEWMVGWINKLQIRKMYKEHLKYGILTLEKQESFSENV